MRSSAWSFVVAASLLGACSGGPGAPSATPAGATPPATAAGTEATAPVITPQPPVTAPPSAATPPTPAPTPTSPPIAITSVECLSGQTVRIKVSIADEAGIVSYRLWSTWGGGGETTRSFPTPYPTRVDEEIEFTHAIVDPEPRVHQFGLEVALAGATDPILAYEIEPDNRCPGH